MSLGLESDFKLYINHLCTIFDEIRRVLKNEGTCWVNLGDSYSQSGGSGSKEYSKKHIQFGKVVEEGEYVPPKRVEGMSQKCLLLIPDRFAIEMIDRGWILRNKIIWYKPSCMPSSAKDRFTIDFEEIFFFTKQPKYFFNQQLEPTEDYQSRNMRTVWRVTFEANHEDHYAAYPQKLVRIPIQAGCPEDGLVLDPFFGSGTTGMVARKLNRNYVGIELNPKYVDIARRRLFNELGLFQ